MSDQSPYDDIRVVEYNLDPEDKKQKDDERCYSHCGLNIIRKTPGHRHFVSLPRHCINAWAICPHLSCAPVCRQYRRSGGSIHEPQVKFSQLALKVEKCIVNLIVKTVRVEWRKVKPNTVVIPANDGIHTSL